MLHPSPGLEATLFVVGIGLLVGALMVTSWCRARDESRHPSCTPAPDPRPTTPSNVVRLITTRPYDWQQDGER